METAAPPLININNAKSIGFTDFDTVFDLRDTDSNIIYEPKDRHLTDDDEYDFESSESVPLDDTDIEDLDSSNNEQLDAGDFEELAS